MIFQQPVRNRFTGVFAHRVDLFTVVNEFRLKDQTDAIGVFQEIIRSLHRIHEMPAGCHATVRLNKFSHMCVHDLSSTSAVFATWAIECFTSFPAVLWIRIEMQVNGNHIALMVDRLYLILQAARWYHNASLRT